MKSFITCLTSASYRFQTIGIILLSCLSAYSQTTFKASINRQSVPINKSIQVNFTLQNGEEQSFTPPSFDGFQIASGPNVSTSVQIVNFDMTKSKTWSYILRPQKEGNLTIQSASVKVKNATLKTDPVTLKVTGASASNQQKNQPQKGQNRDSSNPGNTVSKDEFKENVFVRLTLDKSNAYVGEQITATYKLYSRLQIAQMNVTKSSVYNGFWTQQIDIGNNQQFHTETYNGQQFNTIVLERVALFPQRPGKLEITPLEMETMIRMQIKSRPRSIFDEIFGSYQVQNVPFSFKSNGATLNIKSLPIKEKPTDFKGAVGNYTLETNLDKTDIQTDDPVTFSIKIKGQGNVRMINDPEVNLPPNFEVYDPKVNESVSKKSGIVNGSKSYDYLIIPRAPGTYKLTPISFSYFDPEQKKYIRLSSKEFNLKVEGEPSTEIGSSSTGIGREELEMLSKDIRYIKTKRPDFKTSNAPFITSGGFLALFFSPIILFFGLLVFKQKRQSQVGDLIGTRKRRASKIAHKRLKTAQTLMDSQDRKGFYNEVSRASWEYISHKLNINKSELNRQNVAVQLTELHVEHSKVEAFIQLIDTCEMAIYASTEQGEGMKSVYENAIKVIESLEEAIV